MSKISKELLNMMYEEIDEGTFGDLSTYWCTDENGSKTLIFVNNKTEEMLQYSNMIRYTTYKDIGVIELENELILIDLSKLQILNKYSDTLKCEYIYDSAVAIPTKNRLIVYSFIDQKEIFNEECKCSNKRSDRAIGRIYDFINFGKTSILVKRDGTVGAVFHVDKLRHIAIADKSAYCDIIVSTVQNNADKNYLREDNYFVCGLNVYNTKEYLEFLTVKSTKEAYANHPTFTIRLLPNGEVKPDIRKNIELDHYEIVTDKGFTGTLSLNLRCMKLKKVLNNKNILRDEFDNIRNEYLI